MEYNAEWLVKVHTSIIEINHATTIYLDALKYLTEQRRVTREDIDADPLLVIVTDTLRVINEHSNKLAKLME